MDSMKAFSAHAIEWQDHVQSWLNKKQQLDLHFNVSSMQVVQVGKILTD